MLALLNIDIFQSAMTNRKKIVILALLMFLALC